MTNPPLAPAEIAVFHPERLVAILGRFKVSYILVGGVAARLHGYPYVTAVAEITPALEPANFESLSGALKHLGARVFTEATPQGLSFEINADALAAAPRWQFVTTCGRLDVLFQPAGTRGYSELYPTSIPFRLHGDPIAVASLEDLTRIKAAEAQPAYARELAALAHLRQHPGVQPNPPTRRT